MNRTLSLVAILSAIALGAAIVRAVAQLQLMATVGGGMTVGTLVLLETGNWLGWTVWSVLLALTTRRLPGGTNGGMAIHAPRAFLALAPLVVVPLVSSPWHWLVTASPGILASASHIVGHNLPTNLLLGVAMLAVAVGHSTADRTRRLERTAAELRTQLAESQLATLRAQLDPHFLFNALNSAAVLARRGDGVKVERVISHLAALLRHSLDQARAQVVPLRVELEVLRHYLDIEQVRHGERLTVRWNVQQGLEDRLVPSFLLQPLVENAIHHGFTEPMRGLSIEVSIARDDDTLTLFVEDDGDGLALAEREKPDERIGLGHARARLHGLYGDRASLALSAASRGRGARVTIVLPADADAGPTR